MNKQEEIIRLAKEKGYVVDDNGNVVNIKGYMLSLHKNTRGAGYMSFNLRLNGSKPTRCFVHKLQAFQKFGDMIFNENIVVRHKNGDSTDNSIDNILIGTQSENMQDIPKEKRILNSSNPKHEHEMIINDRKNGMSYKDIMEKYNISSKGTVSFIVNKSLKKSKK